MRTTNKKIKRVSAVTRRGIEARKMTAGTKDSTAQMLREIRSGCYA